MKNLFNIILVLALLNTLSIAGPAISGTRLFTQPDGTQFEGILKGDSSFHWIESNGNVVIYNPQDKFYYEATIDIDKGLILTNNKPEAKVNGISTSSSLTKKHKVADGNKKILHILYKKAKTGDQPK